MSNNQLYWIGPYGILVPQSIDDVVDEDGVNILYKNGTKTKLCANFSTMNSMSYKTKYAKFDMLNGHWIYKSNNTNNTNTTNNTKDMENNTYLIKMEIDKATVFKDILFSLNKSGIENIHLHCNKKGIIITETTPDNLCLCRITLPFDKFKNYELFDNVIVKVSIIYLLENIRNMKSRDILKLLIKKHEKSILYVNDNPIECEIIEKLETMTLPPTSFSVKVSVPGKDLYNTYFYLRSNSTFIINILVKNNILTLIDGDDDNINTDIINNLTKVYFENKANNTFISNDYELSYLMNYKNLLQYCGNTDLYLRKNYPLVQKIEFPIGNMILMISPLSSID